MAKGFNDNIITAIDIGTTKICVLVAKKIGEEVEVLGMGRSPSHGLKKGIVTDINKTVQSIKAAVKEAELVSDYSIESAVVGISGSHITAFNSHGAVPIKRNNRVSSADIASVLIAAKAMQIPEGNQVLHVLPQFFRIDSQDKIKDPLGMHGIRLEAQVHIITGSIASAQNIIQCCLMSGVQVKDIVLEQLASAEAVLSQDERELGVTVLDIGGGTADFALFQNGSIRHTLVVPVAGNHFTNDIAIGLQSTIKDAERVKQLYGVATSKCIEGDSEIEIVMADGVDHKKIKISELTNIIELRAEELLSIIRVEIEKHNLKHMISTGMVLTGGGSMLKGLDILAQDILGMPVRIGVPQTNCIIPESLNSPIYATSYGLLLHAFKQQKNDSIASAKGPLMFKVFDRMKSWISDFF
ncbi:cell division protein FtsA [candidate division TM6 bacterium RIFCSPHIGHO2_12_FULL_32_22]|nr:MAG: cell division protein FtsA [candidate division TM6 bacterium RIFCSPHIGHO2_12_FULL_32_22]